MNDTQKQIAAKQKEYESLVREGTDHRNREKDMRKQFEEKLKNELRDHGLDGESIANRKRQVSGELRDLKNQRVGEIVADVSLGTTVKSAGIVELIQLGYTEAAAEIELRRATGEPVRAEAPIPVSQGPEAPDLRREPETPNVITQPTNVIDPAGAKQPESQLAVLTDGNDPDAAKKAAELKTAEENRLAAEKRDDEQRDAEARRDSASSTDKPLAAGAYASVSNETIEKLIEANDAAIKALPDVAAPHSRVEAIALLVRAGVRPPRKPKN